MTWLADAALSHLRQVADLPDLSGTRYRLRQRIGLGGMGVVYLAEDTSLKRLVALKVLRDPVAEVGAELGAELGAEPDAAERLRREAQVLARLEHPAIVPVHDAGLLPDGRTFYTMKWVQGRRLDELASQTLPLGQCLNIFERICEAVAFAHSQDIVHRDLKPENVMVGAFGEVLVMDWGVAKVLSPGFGAALATEPASRIDGGGPEASVAGTSPKLRPSGTSSPTLDGTVLGTPGYMPPEQARGDIASQDGRADIYSLGALLHFLLAGNAPDPAGPSLKGNKRLRAIVERALQSNPADRYAKASDLLAEIARFRAGEAVDAYQESLLDRLGRFYQRYRAAILLILAYLLMRATLFFAAGY